jgi:two-component system response regulator AtoC
MCATDKNLEDEIAKGSFRADLYYRINVVSLTLPALRDRSEDIPLMAEHFLARCQEQFGVRPEPLSRETLQYMERMEWPGNIRELSSTITRHVVIGPEAWMREDLERSAHSFPMPNKNEIAPLKRLCKEAIRAGEKKIILAALRANRWNRRKAAVELKISYRLLIYKIRDAGLITKQRHSVGSRQQGKGGRPPSAGD